MTDSKAGAQCETDNAVSRLVHSLLPARVLLPGPTPAKSPRLSLAPPNQAPGAVSEHILHGQQQPERLGRLALV